MKEFIGTNVAISGGTINLGVAADAIFDDSTNADGITTGELLFLGRQSLGSAATTVKTMTKDGTDALIKSRYGFQIGVKTPTLYKWSGWIPNNFTTVVTKCTPTTAATAAKTYTLTTGYMVAGMWVGMIVSDLGIPYYQATKRNKTFEYQLVAADITSGVINTTGYDHIVTAFNAKFSTSGLNKWTLSNYSSGTGFTLTAIAAGTDFRLSGTFDTPIIKESSIGTQPLAAFNTLAQITASEKSAQIRSGYNPFWEIDATLWTAPSMVATVGTYTTYVIEYLPTGVVEPLRQYPLHSKRECLLAVPTLILPANSGVNPDIAYIDAIFTAMARGTTAWTASATANTGTHANDGISTGGLIFRLE